MDNFSPITDHLLLQQIFSNLTLSDVKVARLVSGFWAEEGALNFRHRALNIQLNPVHMTHRSRMTEDNLVIKVGREEERNTLRDFLASYKISHTLHLSLLGFHPWLHSTPTFEVYIEKNETRSRHILIGPFHFQYNNLHFPGSVLSNYFFKTAPFIKELRLELMLKQEQDFKNLEQIVEALKNSLDKCSLYIVVLKDAVLQRNAPIKDHKCSKTKTLFIRIRLMDDTTQRHLSAWFWFSAPKTVLFLFPNISFLDLVGWREYKGPVERQYAEKTSKLLTAATELELKIDGLHAGPRTEADFQAILNYCAARPLKFLYINIHWREAESSTIIPFINGIIKECVETLERFDLTWRLLEERPCQQMQLPILKKLKSLTYVSKYFGKVESSGLSMQRIEGEVQLRECIGFNELFSDYGGILNSKFPALESLSLILVEPSEEGLWAEIFPPENNEKCISSKIKTLVVTFAGECESEEIQKFPRMLFPQLRQFRHGKWREEGNKLFVCHHEYDAEGRLTGKWSWLAALKNYSGFPFEPGTRARIIEHGNYFYTIREKFRVRLGDHGFWDTAWDIERTE